MGVISRGISTPIIREGDDLKEIFIKSISNALCEDEFKLKDNDVIGITESVVARAEGNYVTIDDIANETKRLFGENQHVGVLYPILSRNRFAPILRGIARGASKVTIMLFEDFDEVGNVIHNHPFTGLNYDDVYREIVKSENCECEIIVSNSEVPTQYAHNLLVCCCHGAEYIVDSLKKEIAIRYQSGENDEYNVCTLSDYFNDKCEYGLLGSNKASEEKVKLFPSTANAQKLVDELQEEIQKKFGVKVDVMVYGDGCFKDPVGGIWEFADPVVSPAYTKNGNLNGTLNEIKIKYFADGEFADKSGNELTKAIKEKIAQKDANLVGNMASEGTTPRNVTDLLGSLMDLTSGSGDKGTPMVIVQNYFTNYSDL